ncbi:MAG TPA: CHAT domain-containing protein [Streptosporangiaceae bacterium]|nr:CHAT domain-containing protein [Streptosporangiaceae bacterium]
MTLVLGAVDVRGSLRWRWLLTDGQTGAPLADHAVKLDADAPQVRAFADVYGYVQTYAARDRWAQDEARLVTELGAWAGATLLGEQVGAKIVAEAPVTVQVTAEFAQRWPLELAHVAGVPLAARGDVSLVYGPPGPPGPPKAPIASTARVLAVFSQPTRSSVLALRRERYALARLIRRLAGPGKRRVELTVVQYGVTRERLAEIADTGDGWDVLHLSGHGGPGLFVLEHADGSPDPVAVADLVAMLRPARRRVKLAVVSACESAVASTAQTLRLLGLAEQAEQVQAGGAGPAEGSAGVAAALVDALDCPVVAMRYPVDDEFAIGFGGVLYERLLGRGQPLDVAVARAVKSASGVSLATPGVFGARAVGLTLPVPRGSPQLDPDQTPTAYLPPEPARFVGRAAAMAQASTALAPESGRTAVLLHGMAGAGKTACAVELAYRYQDSFAAVAFWQATGAEFTDALADLALTLEAQLGRYGFAMTGHIGSVPELTAFLPRLRQVMTERGVLLVLDNLETLLTAEGSWRDPRWDPLIAALTGHDGESRVIMTSRTAPASLDPGVLVLPVHALSLGEAVALARELPNLRGLLHAGDVPVRAPAGSMVAGDRDRVRRVLRVVQGHPKLMELADAAAADRGRLDVQLAAAEGEAGGLSLDAFFRDGDSALGPGEFLAALGGWTVNALEVLAPEARLMAWFVACLEDGDRRSDVIEATWAGLWEQLGRPGDPPAPGPLLAVLAAAALIQPGDGTPVTYRVHPGVAAAIAAAAGPGLREAADGVLAGFWVAAAGEARAGESGEDSGQVVAAGLAAAPYLLRRADWDTTSGLLDEAIRRDRSPGVAAAVLPALRRAAAAGTPWHRFRLARALRYGGQGAEAEPLLRDTLDAAVTSGDYRLASAVAGDLAYLLRGAGRLGEALAVAGEMAGYSERAGLGPWTQLLDQVQRLQILAVMGEHEQVLAEAGVLRERMGLLPARRGPGEAVEPWNVREVILGTGYGSALALGEWQECLDLNAEVTASKRQRGAGLHDLTCVRFNDAFPLMRLGRLGEAGGLLRECQQVFEDHHDTPMLAMVLSTRASLEYVSGRAGAAADLERTAIRYSYATAGPRDIAISHHNLANYLGETGGDRAGQQAHRLAAALIWQLTGMTHDLADAQRALAAELRAGPGADLPATLAAVIQVAELTDGVRLGDLIAVLEPDPQAAEQALAEILRAAAGPGDD